MIPRILTRFLMVALLATLATASPSQAELPAGEEPAFDESITVPELFEKARDAFGLDELSLAELFYEGILIREPNNLQAMLELANVYERGGKLEYARGLLIRASKLAPQNTDISTRRKNVDRLLVAVLDEEIKQLVAVSSYQAAIPKISLRMSVGGENEALFYKRALCLTETGQFDAALEDLEQAIRIDPRDEYYALRERITHKRTRGETIDLKVQARALAQSDSEDDHEEALKLLGQVLKMEPENEWARAEFKRLSAPAVADTIAALTWEQRLDRATEDARFIGSKVYSLVERNFLAMLGFVALWIILRSPLMVLITGRMRKPPLLSGQLTRFTLPEILLMLNAEPHTGVLRVRARGGKGNVYFENGEPRHCTVGRMDGNEALIELINRSMAGGNFEFVEGAMPVNRSIDTPLSLILIEQAKGSPVTENPNAKRDDKKSKMKELLESRR